MTTLDAPVKWGILSTANINRKVIPGANRRRFVKATVPSLGRGQLAALAEVVPRTGRHKI